MSHPTVNVETRGSVAVVTIDRPDSANTLTVQVGMDLLAAALTCGRNPAVRAVVLTGAGKHFCFGGDLRAFLARGVAIDAYISELTGYLHSAISHFVRMDAPVIAAVNGTAAGGGVGFVAMADLAVAGESSKFSLAYTSVALVPDCSTSFFLPRILGTKRAMELMLTNRTLSATEALEWGLVNRVVSDAKVLDEAIRLAEQLAAGPLHAYGKTKRLLAQSVAGLESQMVLESEGISLQAATPEGQEGIHAFLEKRRPRFTR
jgi:2-(1,2-epoxy-1,2-dihydrophenyl)acetyl-CoA isomerase